MTVLVHLCAVNKLSWCTLSTLKGIPRRIEFLLVFGMALLKNDMTLFLKPMVQSLKKLYNEGKISEQDNNCVLQKHQNT